MPSFSYVIDRNFVTFEDYFKNTGGAFDINFVLTIHENFESFFSSELSFDIDEINAKIYHSPPSSEQFVNPEVTFDIDLSIFFRWFNVSFDSVLKPNGYDIGYINGRYYLKSEVA